MLMVVDQSAQLDETVGNCERKLASLSDYFGLLEEVRAHLQKVWMDHGIPGWQNKSHERSHGNKHHGRGHLPELFRNYESFVLFCVEAVLVGFWYFHVPALCFHISIGLNDLVCNFARCFDAIPIHC